MEEEVCTEADLSIQESQDAELLLLCRLCATESDKCLGIFDDEGVANDIPTKINLYLPIKVTENDMLPSQCCWSCATTLMSWHEMVLCSIEADKRLRELHTEGTQCDKDDVKDLEKCVELEVDAEPDACSDMEPDQEIEDDPDEPAEIDELKPEALAAEPSAASLNTFCQMAPPPSPDYKRRKSVDALDKDLWLESADYAGPEEEVEEPYIKVEEPDVGGSRRRSPAKRAAARKSAVIKSDLIKIEEESVELLDNVPLVVRSEDDPDLYQFVCQYCSTLHESEEEILQHMQKEHPAECEKKGGGGGGKKDRRKNTKIDQEAVNAAKVVVEGRVYYNCKVCAKSLHSPYTYIWHMRIHTGERPFVCDLCGKQFRVSQGLVRHLKETHEGIKNFPCDLCGRMFATRRNVEEHRRIHTNERPYICDLCGKAFKQKASLFVHNRSHSNLFPYHCSYCNQGFRTRPPLLIHMTRHTGEKPYPCAVCGRCFRIKYELKRHMLIHSDVKPFVCHLCGLSFRQKRYLRNHNKINHNPDALT